MPDPIPPASTPPVPVDQALVIAHETIRKLTLRIKELEIEVSDMEGASRRQKRQARQNDTALRNDLAAAQNRRG